MANQLILPAYAKINRFLHITGRLANGYHQLQTLMQLIDLKDTLTFELAYHDQINIHSTCFISSIEDNLVYKAAMAIKPYAKSFCGVDIHIEKRIPMGGGLGGGSSDAATTLIALNTLWHCNLNQKQLIDIGAKLGADIPIFIFGQTAWTEGIGEKLMPFKQEESLLLICCPNIHICTKSLFQHPELKRNYLPIKPENYCFDTTENAFEVIIKNLHPQIKTIMDEIKAEAPVRLTGSGGCFYVICQDFNQLEKLQKKFDKRLDTIPSKALNYAAVAYDDLSKRGNLKQCQ
ncbi:4-(cytidine 5'-diphospho)-2-C-methyl-D-erythritol kinase [Thiotrichales bacterium 19S3-7]|nr:4-(cytidine 5'-diphospho)-2-C-methyl-D-erythritol kinase [Thiotrichales bacterium 19S3-7]MCF6802468.1 4-(cytidine 5'-diphospho)-2-C-methyl-D-erythritol kinase [Thiotrichales bacterium 19S3-11]